MQYLTSNPSVLIQKMLNYLYLNHVEYCWIRMPTGCDRTLSEQEFIPDFTPEKWFIDPYNKGPSCQDSRRNYFNGYCNRTDTLNYWGTYVPGNTY